ncbi:armadillo-type protein [Scenedesmus sp. NREL 46B-D3]|nr:armadillo-type protein [Scenedesmus sp. NREL 46B-D3]
MAPKPVLKQEEFDEAVKTNIEDFGMEADEAVSSAVEEFQLQGYSLEGIIKSSSGGSTDSHPVAVATRALSVLASSAAEKSSTAAAVDVQLQNLQLSVSALQQQFKGLSGDDLQQALAVAAKEGSIAALLSAAKAAQQLLPGSTAKPSSCNAVLLPCLRTMRLLMQSPACRSSLLSGGGDDLLQRQLQGCCKALQSGGAEQQQEQQQLAAAAAALTEAAAWQDEEGKCRFIDMGVAADLLQLLQLLAATPGGVASAPQAAAAAAAAGAAAGALRAFTTADDDRPPASKAFMHARLLAGKPNNALQVLLPVLQQLQQGPSRHIGPLVAVLAAIRQIAANDEICKSFAEAGGVASLQQLLAAAAVEGPPELVRGAAAALRQLANSDAVKSQLAEAGALITLMRAVRLYGSHPAVQEQLLGLLVALVLRMPDIAAAAAEAGGIDVLTEVLAAAPAMAAEAKVSAAAAAANGVSAKAADGSAADASNGNGSSSTADADDNQEVASKVFGVGGSGSSSSSMVAAVQRQACMAVRNMVVRNPELRPGFLAAGAEDLLRAVKLLFPGSCKDVASAALRDLGLEHYN